MSENDSVNQANKSRLSLLIKIQVVVAIVAILVTVVAALQIGPLIKKKANLEKNIKAAEKALTEKKDELQSLDKQIAQLKPLAKKGLGFKIGSLNPDPDIPETSLKAVNAAKNIVSNSDAARRKKITVVLYKKNLEKEVNTDIVIPSLKQLGFKIAERSSSIQSVSTNTIWFGSNVNIDDVKLVAYQLIGAGIEIKSIKPFKNPDRKPRRIDIGGDASIQIASPLSVEEISKAGSFDR